MGTIALLVVNYCISSPRPRLLWPQYPSHKTSSPKSPFSGTLDLLFLVEKGNLQGLGFGTVLDQVAPQEKRKTLSLRRARKGEIAENGQEQDMYHEEIECEYFRKAVEVTVYAVKRNYAKR